MTEPTLCGILSLMHTIRFNEIFKINDPTQRLIAGIVFQAFVDMYHSPTPEVAGAAEDFLRSGGGAWNDYTDYDIKEMFDKYMEDK